ncbi:MAG TPA: D-alanyl-lipoteichoic acid biosynthesis protein DltB, partial [Clostridium sp.]|nr:D-alanyl-lipoteichoic acid biosynthesis protein DltB [Clostridium sp.]
MFLLGEIILINSYLEIRDRTDNKFIYYLVLFLSMLPIIITKVSVKSIYGPIGFIGLSYLNFKAIQIIIEIYDGTIKGIKFSTLVYFIIFFPTLSSGPIDRYRRFEENINTKIDKEDYINNYLFEGLKRIIRGVGY